MNTGDRHLKEFEEIIGYSFKDIRLLKKALTHSSYSNERRMGKLENNERLEFLGDAVLELISSEFLYEQDQRMPEGDLTKLRASLVCEQTLAFCARKIRLGDFLLLGKGENATGGRERDSILSDAMEAVIGALYLDGGFTSAKEHIIRFILSDIEKKKLFYDSKTILQELVQSEYKLPVSYKLLNEEGPDHNKNFTVSAYMGDMELKTGSGKTKKAAQQDAAYQSILYLKQNAKAGDK